MRVLAVTCLLAACASNPVHQRVLSAREAVNLEHPTVYDCGELSRRCESTLDAAGLSAMEPADAALVLGSPCAGVDDPERLLARAEILYWLGDRAPPDQPDRAARLFRDSALAAVAALRAGGSDGIDPARTRAIEAHDHALARYLPAQLAAFPKGGVTERLREGEAGVDVSWELSPWGAGAFDDWLVARSYQFDGLRNRHRREGLGVPLILARPPRHGIPRYYTPEQIVRGGTAILEPEGDGPVLRVVDPAHRPRLRIGGTEVAVAADTTAPYGYLLANANLHEIENSSFFEADALGHEGLFLLEDYDPDRVPVVMVHGLWSSPFTWRELTNEILGDPVLHAHYQVWHYMYATGAPLLENARLLRKSLRQARRDLDPALGNRASRGIVLIGHSMGGLLSRIVLQSSGDRIWNTLFTVPPESLDLPPEQRTLARELYFFEALDFVDRAIFIATPHRGSELADSFIGRLGSAMIKIPRHLVELVDRIRGGHEGVVRVEVPTSVDELSGTNAVNVELAALPIREGVPYHSIMGDITGDPDHRSDGVVPYASSTLPGARSELVVPGADHGVNNDPRAVAEVRRILREAIAEDAARGR